MRPTALSVLDSLFIYIYHKINFKFDEAVTCDSGAIHMPHTTQIAKDLSSLHRNSRRSRGPQIYGLYPMSYQRMKRGVRRLQILVYLITTNVV
jgi:hypothetical protein